MKEIQPVLSQRRILSGSLCGTLLVPSGRFHRDRRKRVHLKVKRAYWKVGVQVNKRTGRWRSCSFRWKSKQLYKNNDWLVLNRNLKIQSVRFWDIYGWEDERHQILFSLSAVMQHTWLWSQRHSSGLCWRPLDLLMVAVHLTDAAVRGVRKEPAEI